MSCKRWLTMPGLALLLFCLAGPDGFGNAKLSGFGLRPVVGALTYYSRLSPEDGAVTAERRPRLGLRVSTEEGAIPGNVSLELDGAAVMLADGAGGGEYSYQPVNDLAPGRHEVRVSYRFAGYQPVTQTARFTVLANMLDPFAGRDAAGLAQEESGALVALNQFRQAAGLPRLLWEAGLSRSAQAHSNYLTDNGVFGHYERTGDPGFTGVGPGDRVAYFGYFGSAGEGVSSGDPTAALAVDALMDAPYHRLGHLNPNYREAGIGYNAGEGGNTVVDYGTRGNLDDDRLVLYPYPGQTDAKVGWYVQEDPNPLASYGKDGIYTGYPISLSVHDSRTREIRVQAATLTDAGGQAVPCYLVDSTRETDRKTQVFLIPKEPLELGTSYTVSVQAQRIGDNGDSRPIDRKWSFTTLAAPAITAANIGKLGSGEYIMLRLNTGELSDLAYTLKRDGKTYQSYNTKGDRYYTSYQPLVNGQYTLVLTSARFPAPLALVVEVAGTAGSWTLRLPDAGAGSIRVSVDGRLLTLDALPLLVQGRTLVPMRAIFTALGLDLQWEEATRTVTGRKVGTTIVLPVGGVAATVNGLTVPLDVPARLSGGRAMVPTRFVAESTGATVTWDENTRTVRVTSQH